MRIIQDFYFGNLQPMDIPPRESREYKQAFRTVLECEEKLRTMLSGDAEQVVSRLIEAQNVVSAETAAEHFERGFRLGVQIICGCFG